MMTCRLIPVIFLIATVSAHAAGPKNWLLGGSDPAGGRFESVDKLAYPWHGVDARGELRKSVSLPTTNPFVTKSNQFSYAWLGTSASFVDIDGDRLPDLVSPDGNGIVWFWKNLGSASEPRFGRGEVVPALFDDLRSTFKPILAGIGKPQESGNNKPDLTPAQESAKRRVDEKRERELGRLIQRNERLPKNKQLPKKDLEEQVRQQNPYTHEKPATPTPAPTPEGRLASAAPIPPGGLSCELNSFRQLRLALSVADWNGDGAPDLIAGDSGGAVYFGKNSGKPGAPQFGYYPCDSASVPLKVVRTSSVSRRPPTFRSVEFLNYAMPFVCDWDGNNIPDLVLGEGTYSVNSVRLFRDAAKATFQSPPKEEFLYVGEDRTFLAPFSYDWDGDGDLDLFVNDANGRLTVHRRTPRPSAPGSPRAAAGELDEPVDLTLQGGNTPLAYAVPQPCDWNADGTMDLLWGDPFGRIMVAMGTERGGLSFSAPKAVASTVQAEMIEFPTSESGRGRISLAASPARVKDNFGGIRRGGTASSENYFSTGGLNTEGRANSGGWPEFRNKAFYGLMPSWSADPEPSLADQFHNDRFGRTANSQPSWAIAPLPGDIWEVVDEVGAPGDGRTLLLRWHPTAQNAVFRSKTVRPPQWTPGAAIYFSAGRPNPFASHYTDKPITISFRLKLDGAFTRLDVKFLTNLGDLVDGKPPAPGGEFIKSLENPPNGQWFEFKHTEPPESKWKRGLDGVLSIEFLGEGEIRLRDVKVLEEN
jgi:hypothetical protein